jgi:hypothetical protein
VTGDPCHRARQDKVRRRPVTKQKLGKSELCSDWLGWVPIDADRHGNAGVLSEAVGGYPDRVWSASRVYPKLSEVVGPEMVWRQKWSRLVQIGGLESGPIWTCSVTSVLTTEYFVSLS